MKIEKMMVASADGCPLMLQRAAGPRRNGLVVLLGHGPSVNSSLMAPCIEAFCDQGAVVWAGDLRGHGGSISTKAPKAHLDPETGWQQLRDDMQCFAQIAFSDCPREHRLLVGGGLSGHVMLDLVLSTPDLARHLVLAGPMPPQRGVGKVVEGFLRVRRLTRPVDAPDRQLVHHIYRFLRARIAAEGEDNERTMLEVLTADPEQLARVLADPTGFPTPTLGYWLATLPGIQRSWTQGDPGTTDSDLRVLMLTGPEDPQSQGGRLLPKGVVALSRQGVSDVTIRHLPFVRANILIDAAKVPIAQKVLSWMQGAVPAYADKNDLAAGSMEHVAEPPALATAPMDLTRMIAKCYTAIDDDRHWVDLIASIASAAEDEAQDIDGLLETLHPHWQRAFELREELRWAARMGRVYHDVIDRLELGVAVLDPELQLGHANPAFKRILARLMGATEANLARMTAALIASQQETPRLTGPGADKRQTSELPILLDGRVVGLWMEPGARGQNGLQAEPIGGLLILRDPAQARDQGDTRANLLMLAYNLTQKESTVAMLLADGLSTGEVAARLEISEHTIRSHVKQIFDKMQITSRAELSHRILTGPMGWITGQAPSPAALSEPEAKTAPKLGPDRHAH